MGRIPILEVVTTTSQKYADCFDFIEEEVVPDWANSGANGLVAIFILRLPFLSAEQSAV